MENIDRESEVLSNLQLDTFIERGEAALRSEKEMIMDGPSVKTTERGGVRGNSRGSRRHWQPVRNIRRWRSVREDGVQYGAKIGCTRSTANTCGG